jgi:hypothetical protein
MFLSKKAPSSQKLPLQQQKQHQQQQQQPQHLSQHQQQVQFHQQQIDYLNNASGPSTAAPPHAHHLHNFKSDVRTKNVMLNANRVGSPVVDINSSKETVCVTLAQQPSGGGASAAATGKLATQMRLIASNNQQTGKIYQQKQSENINLKYNLYVYLK